MKRAVAAYRDGTRDFPCPKPFGSHEECVDAMSSHEEIDDPAAFCAAWAEACGESASADPDTLSRRKAVEDFAAQVDDAIVVLQGIADGARELARGMAETPPDDEGEGENDETADECPMHGKDCPGYHEEETAAAASGSTRRGDGANGSTSSQDGYIERLLSGHIHARATTLDASVEDALAQSITTLKGKTP